MTDAADATATDGPRRKHRHDLGHEDHGPVMAAGTTRAIQVLLGLWIAATFVLVAYALVTAVRPASPASSATGYNASSALGPISSPAAGPAR